MTATFLPARRRWILIPSAVAVAAALGGVVAAASGDAIAKLNVSSRHAAAHRAWEEGWI